jgi:putative radical SAM enzyme (TIGR03279 family)
MSGCGPGSGVVVADVRPRTPAARAGLRAGDRILAINGAPLRDVIDFHFHGGEPRLRLAVEREGRPLQAALDRHGPDLGLELEPPRPGEIATCANKCVFCFIHQLPRGMRKSLYVKDDDFRLSFLHGNYITLTDLGETELQRIEEQRLSPLFISVHATDPELRHRLLGQPRAKGDLMPRMERLARAGIAMHAQIVLCPDWNDGPHLERSVRELAALHPAVRTTAVVPVGLTRHRERLPALRPVTAEEARHLVATIHRWQRHLRRRLGTRFVFAADELYLMGGVPVPGPGAYEGFPIAEDGVGLVRRFEDGFARAARRAPPRLAAAPRRVPIANDWFGRGIQVAGLLTARDILAQLAAHGPGEEVLVPAVAVRDGEGVFLDDLAPADIGAALGVPVRVIPTAPGDLIQALVDGGRGAA